MRGLRYALVLTLTAIMPLAGQRPLTVTGIQSLTFGTLIPGIPSVVPRTDAVKSIPPASPGQKPGKPGRRPAQTGEQRS